MERTTTRSLGGDAEELAFRYLIKMGFKPVTRNFNCRLGELDLVMLDGDCLVFVEVRYRSGRSLVAAAMTVDGRKQQKLVRAAAMFLARHPAYASRTTRFDVIGIDDDGGDGARMQWIRDAFRPG